ncbi:MAG: sigma-54 interaction domain-containing protein [Candidatus Poribacteria bacterium]
MSIQKDLAPDKSCLQQRLKLEAIFNSVSDGIIALDEEHQITSFNRAAGSITGVAPQDALDRPYTDVFKVRSLDLAEILAEAQENGKRIEEMEVEIDRADGRKRTVMLNIDRLVDVDGNLAGTVLIFRDISEVRRLKEELRGRYRFHNLIGKSHQMQELYRLIEQTADSDASVIIEGESGTGKELVAHAIHYNSPRADGPFVPVNCSALPETLLESELFGHVKGAFTGAMRDKIGRFEAADGGTIFLDEIGDISPLVQLKLLRFIQERQFERVGDRKSVKVDVRIIAATNKNLKELVREGRFREDLYYRLRVVPIFMPPLRERKEDIPLLVNHFMEKFKQKTGKPIVSMTDAALAAMLDYDWPGNVRELENAIEYAFVRCQRERIHLMDLPKELNEEDSMRMKKESETKSISPEEEKAIILQALEDTRWNKTKAARMLGIGRTTLYKKLKEYQIEL